MVLSKLVIRALTTSQLATATEKNAQKELSQIIIKVLLG
jgi:hypothetical protein